MAAFNLKYDFSRYKMEKTKKNLKKQNVQYSQTDFKQF